MKIDVKFSGDSTEIPAAMSAQPKTIPTEMGVTTVLHDGQNGATFFPSVSDDGVLSWTNDRELDNPAPVNIKGKDGRDGVDGYTPVKGKDYFDGQDGKDGLNGKDGYTPIKGIDYFDGKNGVDGKDGVNGKDGAAGYTPVKGVDYFDGKDGKDGAKGNDGADGYTPVRGTDYWTDADKEEIKSYVDEAILGGEW